MSTSYPYLTLSRRLGVRYGDVLKIVDYLDRIFGHNYEGRPIVAGYGPEWSSLPPPDMDMTVDVWCRERERRRRVLSES